MPPALGLEYNESNSNLGKRPHKLFKTVYIDQSGALLTCLQP